MLYKNQFFRLISIVIGLVSFVAVTVYGINTTDTGFQVNAGVSNVTVDAWGTCNKVSNASAKNYFVPTKTSAEWTAFRNSLPANVTLSACCTTGYLDGDLDGDGAGVYGCYSSGTIVANNNDCDDTNASIKSGSTRTRYQSSTPGCGTACASETQTCSTGGVWSGTYSGTSCTASTQTRYGALTSACGTYSSTSETQTCQTNGTWSPNNYSLTSAPAATTQTRYAAATSTCGTYGSLSETQYCQSNGAFSGSYSLTSAPGATTRTMYRFSSVCIVTCGSYSETQTCQSNGSFNGTYTNSSCSAYWPIPDYYQDADGDGYGNPSAWAAKCPSAPDCIGNPFNNSACVTTGYVQNSTDCYDTSANHYPGRTSYLYGTYGTGSWDGNCNGTIEKEPGSGCSDYYPALSTVYYYGKSGASCYPWGTFCTSMGSLTSRSCGDMSVSYCYYLDNYTTDGYYTNASCTPPTATTLYYAQGGTGQCACK